MSPTPNLSHSPSAARRRNRHRGGVGAVMVALAALGALLAACSTTTPVWRADGDKPWQKMTEPSVWPFLLEQASRLELTNLHGAVELRKEDAQGPRIEIHPLDGLAPGFVISWRDDTSLALALLDDADALADTNPEPPRFDEHGKPRRLGRMLPRCDLIVWLPEGSRVEIPSCAALRIAADAFVRAECGGAATIEGGSGTLDAVAMSISARSANYDVTAHVREGATFSSVVGDKRLFGSGNVQIIGGQGRVETDIEGDVFADTVFSTGRARSRSGLRPVGDDGLTPLGPGGNPVAPRWDVEERTMTANRLAATTVRLVVTAAAALEVFVDVSDGGLTLGLPRDGRVALHEWSGSTAHFFLGKPQGELRIAARKAAHITARDP